MIMFSYGSKALKHYAPGVHARIKKAYFRSGLPAFKLLDGKLIFVAPQMVSAIPTEPHVLRWIKEVLRPGDTFLDVGAHYGWMSMTACGIVGAKGKVAAFEPSPPLIEILQYNKKVNRFRQLEIVPEAVVDSTGQTATFYLENRGNSFLNSLVTHPNESAGTLPKAKSTIQVQTLSLDDYCVKAKIQPNVVKIDIEGAELLALRGCSRLLKECRPDFIVAIHPTWLPTGQKAAEIFEMFHDYGYKLADSQSVEYEGADFGDYLFVPERS
jgi:FkbM family methyltransferase